MSSVSHLLQGPSSTGGGQSPNAAFTERLIRQSKAQPEDRILIVGLCKAEVLLDLYRRGFHHVCHETGHRLPVHDDFDVVWLLHHESMRALKRMLSGLGRILRPGATVVVLARHPDPSDMETPRVAEVRRQFVDCGFLPLTQVSDGASGYLLSAHRPPVMPIPLSATA